MDPDFAQRRRVFVAAAITAVAVPAVFMLDRGGDADTPTLGTLVGTAPIAEAASAAAADPVAAGNTGPAASQAETILGTTPTGYLDGTVPPGDADPPMIAIPRPRDAVTGDATFSNSVNSLSTCLVPVAPNGATVTLTNLDNGRSVQCRATSVAGQDASGRPTATVHPDTFSVIADITDAPVPVEITW